MATLECAGNGRSGFDPPAEGEQWQLGAVSTAEWTGVPLAEVLDRAGLMPEALEIVFRGADRGNVGERPIRSVSSGACRSTSAASQGALLAYAMNGEPLPLEHGYPLRLIVPGWYAVASVKWLTEIEARRLAVHGILPGQALRLRIPARRHGGARTGAPAACPVGRSPSRPPARRSPPATWSSAAWRGRARRPSTRSRSVSATARGRTPG